VKDDPVRELDRLFYPKSVAHVGASIREAVGRFNFTQYLIQMKFQGRILPVNPKYPELLGLKCYPSLAEIPGEIDLAIVAVPAAATVDVIRGCPPGKLKFAVIHTSGFGEIGKGELEGDLLHEARKRGIRLIGPNCLGVYSQEGRVGFWRSHHEIVDLPGTIGFVSQSGGHAVDLLWGAGDSLLFFNKVVSLGNQLDLTINDFLEYMGDDPGIHVLGAYVEDVKDGRRFLEILRRIAPRKPVVIWKGGVSPRGKAAAVTHTGSMAGNEEVFSAALRQAGAIQVGSHWEAKRVLRLLQPGFPLPGRRLAVISPGGGSTVNLCDHFSAHPLLSMPRLSAETERALRELLPEENVDLANPVDPGGTGMARADKLLEVIGQDPNVDTLVLLLSIEFLGTIIGEERRLALAGMVGKAAARAASKAGKPLMILLRQVRENNEEYDGFRRIFVRSFHEHGVPWLDGSFSEAASILEKLAAYRAFREERARLEEMEAQEERLRCRTGTG
jgi:acyl-CoA synthetase (NDP forming)